MLSDGSQKMNAKPSSSSAAHKPPHQITRKHNHPAPHPLHTNLHTHPSSAPRLQNLTRTDLLSGKQTSTTTRLLIRCTQTSTLTHLQRPGCRTSRGRICFQQNKPPQPPSSSLAANKPPHSPIYSALVAERHKDGFTLLESQGIAKKYVGTRLYDTPVGKHATCNTICCTITHSEKNCRHTKREAFTHTCGQTCVTHHNFLHNHTS
jgi:hypothetical protein